MSNLTTNIVDYQKSRRKVIGLFSVTFAICLALYAFFGYLYKGWIFGADAQGFYMIGRSLYFDHDFDFTNELQLDPRPGNLGTEIHLTETGKIDNHAPIGYALLTQPFFLLADIITGSSNYLLRTKLPYDGYRGVFGILVPFATMIYGFVGGYLAYKVIAMFFDKVIASLAINIIILSTSLLWYITGQVTMVHIHSFAALSALMYSTMPFFKRDISETCPNLPEQVQAGRYPPETYRSVRAGRRVGILRYVCVGSFLALATMIRFQNAIFALVPIVAMAQHLFGRKDDGNREPLLNLIGKISLGVFSTFICFIPQIFYYKVVYDSYSVTGSYLGHGWSFDFSKPELLKTLFSTNHGLFLWNPITLISCLGICLLFYRIKDGRLFIFLLSICFVLTWYIVASWDYMLANSFGNRGFDGSTLFFALGWAEILDRLWKKKKIVTSACIMLVLWNVQLLMQQRYLGWLPIHGDVSYLQVFKSYKKLPDEWKRIKMKYFF